VPARATAPYADLVDRLYWRLRPDAMPYFRVLDRIHRHLRPRTYLEVGVSTGGSMTLSLPGTRNVGVDPEPRIELPVSPSTTIVRETSDHFFATHDLGALLGGIPLDLAFIDGMHHFEFALRDFVNIERRAVPTTTVLIHDCYPIDETSAARDRSTEVWSGDVWKLIVCLKEQRPDLTVSVVDVGPTGLGIVTGLDPASRVLEEHLDELEARYVALPYRELDGDKADALNGVPDDWPTVRALLPATPFRPDPLALAETRRWLRAVWPVARRSARRSAARARRRLHPTG
jgi:hypothetical protein